MTSLALPFKVAPFAPAELETLQRLLLRATPEQRAWLAGYLAGLEAAKPATAAAPSAAPRPRAPLTLLYASESGNAEGLALKARKLAKAQGFDARVLDMADADPARLAEMKNIVVFASTWGEGDPPERAADFYAALMSDGAPRLDGLRFAVLALGDSAYTNFCAVGRAIDARLEALGAERVVERIDLDLDFARAAADWTRTTLEKLAPAQEEATEPSGTVVQFDFRAAAHGEEDEEPAFTAEAPLEAEITNLVNLSGTGSTRETWHVELATDAPGFAYLPGDAIGVVAENDPRLVEEVLEAVGLGGDDALKGRLRTRFDVTTLSRGVVESYARLTGRADVAALCEGDAFADFAAGRQLIDLFLAYPERLTGEQLTQLLRPLPPRLYSVASSPAAHAGETHLLVGAVRWTSHGRHRKGVASTYIADRRKLGDTLKVYVRPNRRFRLPQDSERPIIMIGAGTGIAPYRGFVAEREAIGAKGKSWLVFGERNYTHDFLYQLEWQEHLRSGALSRIDVAFSRDQPEKIYVQHRLWERRADVLRWIADGAHIYVCGDEQGMGRDVDAMLARILATDAAGDEEAGRARLKALAREGRYARDLY